MARCRLVWSKGPPLSRSLSLSLSSRTFQVTRNHLRVSFRTYFFVPFPFSLSVCRFHFCVWFCHSVAEGRAFFPLPSRSFRSSDHTGKPCTFAVALWLICERRVGDWFKGHGGFQPTFPMHLFLRSERLESRSWNLRSRLVIYRRRTRGSTAFFLASVCFHMLFDKLVFTCVVCSVIMRRVTIL